MRNKSLFFLVGQRKKDIYTRRKARSTLSKIGGDDEDIVLTVEDEKPDKFAEARNKFLKSSLVDFFVGVKQSESEPTQKKINHTKSVHRKNNVKCKFPFIFDGKTVYSCLPGQDNKNKRWCSLTSNYDRDTRWMYCLPSDTSSERVENIKEELIDVSMLGRQTFVNETRISGDEKTIGGQFNKTSLNHTTNDDLLSNEVETFISAVLSQHDILAPKQEEILKPIRKASIDIADEISYLVAYAKARGITKKDSKNANGESAKLLNNFANFGVYVENLDNSVLAAVDNFLSLVLEKHGVPVKEQKEVLAWNAQLSTDITAQIESMAKNATVSKDTHNTHVENATVQSLRKSGHFSMHYAPEEIEIQTFGGNANGHKCVFPFIYNGDTYFNCININKDKPWCSTTANYDKLPLWGYCIDEQLSIQNKNK